MSGRCDAVFRCLKSWVCGFTPFSVYHSMVPDSLDGRVFIV
jgi:hypothetical protein